MPESKETTSNLGLLSDTEIKAAIQNNLLISENFSPKHLDGCCYEFRVGNICYTYDYENKTTKQIKQDLHTINPFETLTIVTLEKVTLDSKHFLLLFSKGSLFSMGLTPVSTAADPGFRGHLGITMTNLSVRPVQFQLGSGFVKGAFFRLNKAASKVYVGQHGDATMSWPYPSQFHTDPIDFDSLDASCWRFLPPPIRQTISKLNKVESHIKWLMVLFGGLIVLNIVFYPLRALLPLNWYTVAEKILNIGGSCASIIGFLIAYSLLRKDTRG